MSATSEANPIPFAIGTLFRLSLVQVKCTSDSGDVK